MGRREQYIYISRCFIHIEWEVMMVGRITHMRLATRVVVMVQKCDDVIDVIGDAHRRR